MTEYDWKPGDVAMVRRVNGQWHRAICGPGVRGQLLWRFGDGNTLDVDTSSARPLITLDPESDGDCMWLGQLLAGTIRWDQDNGYWLTKARDMLAALLPQPKPVVPPEPEGDAAVMDEERCWWTYADGLWRSSNLRKTWADLNLEYGPLKVYRLEADK